MFIAFEGPDMTGKSTSAATLSAEGVPIYNVTKDKHAVMQKEHLAHPELPITYDRIDWFTHMVYRLALPDREWNDARPRTVFAMPDTHLVIKIHKPELANFDADEAVHTPIATVNEMYYYQADFLMGLNRARGYALFKTVSMIEVLNDQAAGTFSQRMVAFDSPTSAWDTGLLPLERLVDGDASLLAFLQDVDQTIG
ncbi:AAA-ATPase [Microbacterium phage Neferthena]|uniref:AAA-ATPase n=1 Tax=Microbacterium phage Neferthena TaxID=2301539 RepID=A0A385D4D2_9CAUD|nr:thymidylate kinase [Microbacterium phage Neferthena]AXQ52909.1 AAA-ATPase [Microbacterium phage Neferthena]